MESWSSAQTAQWLRAHDFGAYADAFAQNAISGDLLAHAGADMLRELGVNAVGTRLAILHAVYLHKLQEGAVFQPDDYVPEAVVLAVAQHSRATAAGFEQQLRDRDDRIAQLQADLRALETRLEALTIQLRPVWALVRDARTAPGSAASASASASAAASMSPYAAYAASPPVMPPPPPPLSHLPTHAYSPTHPYAYSGAVASVVQSPAAVASPPSSFRLRWSQSRATAASAVVAPPEAARASAFVTSTQPLLDLSPVTPTSGVSFQLKGDVGAIRVYGSGIRDTDGYKSFRVTSDDTVATVLPAIFKKYHIRSDQPNYALFVQIGTEERCLAFDERPLAIATAAQAHDHDVFFTFKQTKNGHHSIARSRSWLDVPLTNAPPTPLLGSPSGPSSLRHMPTLTGSRHHVATPTAVDASTPIVAGVASPLAASLISHASALSLAAVGAIAGTMPMAGPTATHATNGLVAPGASGSHSAGETPSAGHGRPLGSKSSLASSHAGSEAGSLHQLPASPMLSPKRGAKNPSGFPWGGVGSVASVAPLVGIYEYKAARPDELDVAIGDQFTMLRRETGWLVVQRVVASDDDEHARETRPLRGWVPSGCLCEDADGAGVALGASTGTGTGAATGTATATGSAMALAASSTSALAAGPGVPQAEQSGEVLYDYRKASPNEISVSKGERVVIQSQYQHWLLVDAGGLRGWIPSGYVSVAASKLALAAALELSPPVAPNELAVAGALQATAAENTSVSDLHAAPLNANPQPHVHPLSTGATSLEAATVAAALAATPTTAMTTAATPSTLPPGAAAAAVSTMTTAMPATSFRTTATSTTRIAVRSDALNMSPFPRSASMNLPASPSHPASASSAAGGTGASGPAAPGTSPTPAASLGSRRGLSSVFMSRSRDHGLDSAASAAPAVDLGALAAEVGLALAEALAPRTGTLPLGGAASAGTVALDAAAAAVAVAAASTATGDGVASQLLAVAQPSMAAAAAATAVSASVAAGATVSHTGSLLALPSPQATGTAAAAAAAAAAAQPSWRWRELLSQAHQALRDASVSTRLSTGNVAVNASAASGATAAGAVVPGTTLTDALRMTLAMLKRRLAGSPGLSANRQVADHAKRSIYLELIGWFADAVEAFPWVLQSHQALFLQNGVERFVDHTTAQDLDTACRELAVELIPLWLESAHHLVAFFLPSRPMSINTNLGSPMASRTSTQSRHHPHHVSMGARSLSHPAAAETAGSAAGGGTPPAGAAGPGTTTVGHGPGGITPPQSAAVMSAGTPVSAVGLGSGAATSASVGGPTAAGATGGRAMRPRAAGKGSPASATAHSNSSGTLTPLSALP